MRLTGPALASVALAAALCTAQAPSGLVKLENLKDEARPLLIFAARPDDPQLEIQLRTLAEHAAATHDRQIVPFALPYRSPQPTPAKLAEDDVDLLRRRFHVAPGDFAVVLLGKDGGEKLQSSKPLSMDRLSAVIDAMPMRREEMKGR